MVWADQGAMRHATGGCVSIRGHWSCCLHRQQLPRLKELLRGIPMLKLWWSLQTRNNRSCTSWPILLTSPGAQHVWNIEHDLTHIDELEKLTTQASPSSLWTSVWRRGRMAWTHNQREDLTTKELFGWCWHVARLAILEWFQSKAKVRSTTWPTKCWALCRALGMLKLVSRARMSRPSDKSGKLSSLRGMRLDWRPESSLPRRKIMLGTHWLRTASSASGSLPVLWWRMWHRKQAWVTLVNIHYGLGLVDMQLGASTVTKLADPSQPTRWFKAKDMMEKLNDLVNRSMGIARAVARLMQSGKLVCSWAKPRTRMHGSLEMELMSCWVAAFEG